MPSILSLAAIKIIESEVDKLFDRAKARYLGPAAVDKRLYVGFKNELSLPGIFMAAAREEGAVPDKTIIDALVRNAGTYMDAYRAQAKAQVVRKVQAFITQSELGEDPRYAGKDFKTILGGELSEVWATATTNVKRLVDTEASNARNMGTLEGIIAVNAADGIEDPIVYFVVVRDEHLCKECKRLHLLDDEVTPRLWKLSQLGHGYHKRGQPQPKVGGLHPNCRCTMVTLMPGYGFGADGMVKFIDLKHDEYARQRGLSKAEGYEPHDCDQCRLEKSKPTPTFPNLGLPDDRRETPVLTNQRHVDTKRWLIGHNHYRNMSPEEKGKIVSDPTDEYERVEGPRLHGFRMTTVGGKQAGGASANSPPSSALSYVRADKLLPKVKHIGTNSDIGYKLHEDLHNMMVRVQSDVGPDARRNLSENLMVHIRQNDPLAHANIKALVNAVYPEANKSGAATEEHFATMLNYLNDPNLRGALRSKFQGDEEQWRQFDTSIKRGYALLRDGARRADAGWLVPPEKHANKVHALKARQFRQKDAREQGGMDIALNKASLEEIMTKVRAELEHAKKLAAKPVRGYTFKSRHGGHVVTSPDPSKPGRWRATRFDTEGQPVGHTEAESHLEAIKRAREVGADLLSVPADDDIQKSEEPLQKMALVDVKGRPLTPNGQALWHLDPQTFDYTMHKDGNWGRWFDKSAVPHDYSHLLPPEFQQKKYRLIVAHHVPHERGWVGGETGGWGFVPNEKANLVHAVLLNRVGSRMGHGMGRMGRPNDKGHRDFELTYATLEDSPRLIGKGMGQMMMESMLAHAKNHCGATHATLTIHSTPARSAFTKIAARHGIKYSPKPSIGHEDGVRFGHVTYPDRKTWEEGKAGSNDSRYAPTKPMLLKAEEQLQKSDWPTSKYLKELERFGWVSTDRANKHPTFTNRFFTPDRPMAIKHSEMRRIGIENMENNAKDIGLIWDHDGLRPNPKHPYAAHYRKAGFLPPDPDEQRTWTPDGHAGTHMDIGKVLSTKPNLEGDWKVAKFKAQFAQGAAEHKKIPAIQVMDGGDGNHYAVEGDEQLEAARQHGMTHVPVNVTS